MNREDINRMAREAGGGTTWWPLHTDTLERFAALVAATEREACLEIADHCADADMHASMVANAIRARSKE